MPKPVGATPRPAALFKHRPEDFCVIEQIDKATASAGAPGDAAGAGQWLLRLRKRNLDTRRVCTLLARWAGIPQVEVGYAGRKDRRAMAEQWFTVPAAAATRAPLELAAQLAQWRADGTLQPDQTLALLEQHWRQRKLKIGELLGNRFVVRLRPLPDAAAQTLDPGIAALATLARRGCPNLFGPQRFGRSGLRDALDWAAQRATAAAQQDAGGQRRARRKRRNADRWHLSVLRAHLFNQVVRQRCDGHRDCPRLDGDVLLDGVPTGPLWGRGRSATTGLASVQETQALAGWEDVRQVLEHAGPRQDRRALWMYPRDLTLHRCRENRVLSFRLPPGAYASTLLAACFELHEAPSTERAVAA